MITGAVDLFDLAIVALRVLLVAVLYAFLLLVLRAAGRQLQPSAARQLDLQLIVLDGGGSGLTAGQVIDVADGATVGRAERAAIVVADAAVSAEHARLARSGQDWILTDLGSTNGSQLNDAAVHGQTRLQHGDVLALGGVRLRVALGRSSAASQRRMPL